MSKKITLIIFLGIIILSNFIPKVEIGKAYIFQSSDGDFKYYKIESKSGSIPDLEKRFKQYLGNRNLNRKGDILKDKKIYRTFKKEFYKFWRWREYLIRPRYKYPYRKFIEKE